MCGIVGAVQPGVKADQWERLLRAMNDTLSHRGPDDAGWWYDPEAGIGLGHRRLSIVDLSPLGHQPMASMSGRYHLTYNGEIYNFLQLRQELQSLGHAFCSRSDTEVILVAIEQWGVAGALKRFVGMFAFALWDRPKRTLYLARDRLGEKPLYYGWQSDTFLFGSELKALRSHPAWRGEIDRKALALFVRYRYVPAPYSIYRGISKLRPGMLLCLSLSSVTHKDCPTITPYWTAKQAVEVGEGTPFRGNETEAIEQFDTLLREVVAGQMVADVPLGAFLSGGIDSSTIVALMQTQSERPVKTFTIGFHEAAYNEANYAKAVADHLGTEHTELYVTPDEAMAVIPRLPELYDEPFSDSSQIPTFLVSELARRYVTVSLSGDGGDELFGGYHRYRKGNALWNLVGWLPSRGRQAMARTLATRPVKILNGAFTRLAPTLNHNGLTRAIADKSHLAFQVLCSNNPATLYHWQVSHWKEPTALVLGVDNEPPTVLTNPNLWPVLPDFTEWMMFVDTISYLPGDILVKVDRASMGVSLEARVPLLDHRVVEFAWRLPLSMKVRNGESKWLLRQVLYKYVPRDLVDRPKIGFGVPLDTWLRGPLREWAEALLAESRLRQEGLFDPDPIRQRWDEHLREKRNWHYYLWDILMFQAWHERWGEMRFVKG